MALSIAHRARGNAAANVITPTQDGGPGKQENAAAKHVTTLTQHVRDPEALYQGYGA